MKEDWNQYIGKKFNYLTVIRISGKNKYNRPLYECKCDCGNTIITEATRVKMGVVKSCGCLQRKVTAERFKVHGLTNTRIHRIWASMISRCENPNNNRYYVYGLKGISVCDEWRNDFMQFYNWAIANGYSDDLSIDRINNDKGYCPSNCRWATRKVQMNNRSNSRNISYNGTTMTLKQWSECFGFNYKYFHEVMSKNNWDIEKVLNMPYFKERLKCS